MIYTLGSCRTYSSDCWVPGPTDGLRLPSLGLFCRVFLLICGTLCLTCLLSPIRWLPQRFSTCHDVCQSSWQFILLHRHFRTPVCSWHSSTSSVILPAPAGSRCTHRGPELRSGPLSPSSTLRILTDPLPESTFWSESPEACTGFSCLRTLRQSAHANPSTRICVVNPSEVFIVFGHGVVWS